MTPATPQAAVLIVDDNPDDRTLAARAVRQEFDAPRITEIADPAELDAALAATAFDLVVTDYQLRWGTGLDVLRAVRERYPECPVIMFTASGSQEVAVEAMKSGLDDYVVKSPHHVVRLGPAIRGAVERRRLRRRAADLEQRLHDLLDRLNVGVFRLTLYGRLLESNPAFRKILGARAAEDLADTELLRRICWPTGNPGSSDFLRPVGTKSLRQLWLTRLDGRLVCVRINEVVTHDGHELVVDGLLEDITALQSRTPQP